MALIEMEVDHETIKNPRTAQAIHRNQNQSGVHIGNHRMGNRDSVRDKQMDGGLMAAKGQCNWGLVWQLLKEDKEKALASVETDKSAEENKDTEILAPKEVNVNGIS